MKIMLDIKKEKLKSFLKMLTRFDFLTDAGIESVEGMELSEVNKTLYDEDEIKSKEEVKEAIQKYFAQADLPVEKVWLFGSYARNEQDAFSDIDLMIRFKKESKIDLWDFVGIMHELEDILGCKVDLVREGGAKPFAVDNIEKDKILVYEEKATGQRAAGTHT
jgi:predicted nucleotidyltransferase